jgi:hypothetical protein
MPAAGLEGPRFEPRERNTGHGFLGFRLKPADFQHLMGKHGAQVLDVVAEKYPQAYFAGMGAGRPRVQARPSALPPTLTESLSIVPGPNGPQNGACRKPSRRLSTSSPRIGRAKLSWVSLTRASWSKSSTLSGTSLTAFRRGPSPPLRRADPRRRRSHPTLRGLGPISAGVRASAPQMEEAGRALLPDAG